MSMPALPIGSCIDDGQTITLITPREFSFGEALVYLARSTKECLHHVSDHKVYKLMNVNGEKVLVTISSPEENRLAIGFENGVPQPSTRMAVAQYVWEWFDLNADLTPFYDVAKNDSLLKDLVTEYAGLRIMGVPDLFEALCWAITGQQINLTFAYTLKRRFVDSFGEYAVWDNQKYWLFPTPERIAELSPDDLKALQFTGKKSEYIIEVARQIACGHLSKSKLQAMGYKEAENTLVKIRGIGQWTANYVSMRCLRNPSAFPIEDVGLHNAIKQQLHLDRKPTIEEIRQLSAPWKGWEAYATFYLWRSLQDAE